MAITTNMDKEPKWYVLHTYSGYENVAKQNLEITVEKYNLQNRVFDIVIPMEDVLTEKNGKKTLVSKKMMPSYILVKMLYGDDIWHAIVRTEYVTGFVGPKGRPMNISDEEVQKLRLEKVKVDFDLDVGDSIEIVDGPLASFIGKVTSVDKQAQKCKASVEMFGRDTDVELEFSQLRRID